MPINIPVLDIKTKIQRNDYLVWEMMDQGSSEGLAYYSMHDYRNKPTKKKYICILEEFIDQSSPGMAINTGDNKDHIDTQVINDLNQLLLLARTQRAGAQSMRAEGVMGRIRASLSTDLRPPPPSTAFD